MDDFVWIASLESAEEARTIEALLSRQGIPHAITAFDEAAGEHSAAGQKRWGSISAAPAHQKSIMFVLSDLRKDASRLS